MTKPYDTTTKELLEAYPGPWMAYIGLDPVGPVSVVDADLATVAAAADKVYRVGGPAAHLVHVEMQASSDRSLPRRLLRYNAMLDVRHDLRTMSVVVLLRPSADNSEMTGVLDLRLPDGRRVVEFRYHVVRAWRQPVDPILAGPIGTLPMAALADVPETGLRDVIRAIDGRLVGETDPATAATMLKSTFLLSGLRFPAEVVRELFEGTRSMDLLRESSAYELLLEEGMARGMARGETKWRLDEARRIILRLGRARFGPADETTQAVLDGSEDLEYLEALSERLLNVSTWDELLGR